jgi:hypothetical protein
MSGGLVSHSGWIVLGDEVGSAGSFNMTGGTVNQTFGDLEIGDAGTGVFNLGGTGVMNISGTVFVGKQSTGAGTAVQTGGTLNAGSGGVIMTVSADSTGVYTLSGGALITPSTLLNSAHATFAYNGGKFSAGSLNVDGGRVLLSAGGNKVLQTVDIFVDNGGKIDLNDNAMIVDYGGGSPINTVKALIIQGYASGAWTGNGITSSAAATAASSAHKTALGYGEAGTLGITNFRGEPVDSTAVLVRYTYSGDANLDGKVDTLDFNSLAGNFGGTSKIWTQADFNYDGIVDTLDFNNLAANFGQQLAESSPLAGALVPEPSSVMSVGLLVAGLAIRARRRRT